MPFVDARRGSPRTAKLAGFAEPGSQGPILVAHHVERRTVRDPPPGCPCPRMRRRPSSCARLPGAPPHRTRVVIGASAAERPLVLVGKRDNAEASRLEDRRRGAQVRGLERAVEGVGKNGDETVRPWLRFPGRPETPPRPSRPGPVRRQPGMTLAEAESPAEDRASRGKSAIAQRGLCIPAAGKEIGRLGAAPERPRGCKRFNLQFRDVDAERTGDGAGLAGDAKFHRFEHRRGSERSPRRAGPRARAASHWRALSGCRVRRG